MQENGTVKKVTEKFLINSLSVTEAEAMAMNVIIPFQSGEIAVVSVKRNDIAEVFNADAEKFWLVKVAFITIDEKSGKEKRAVNQILVGADNFDDAVKAFYDGMNGTNCDYQIVSLSESPIVEVVTAK